MSLVFMAAYTNYRRDGRVRREAESLAELGHRVIFFATRQHGEPDQEMICGVEVSKVYGIPNSRDSIGGYIASYCVFFYMVMQHLTLHPLRYALIHISNMPDFLVFAAWLPRFLGRPVVHDVHDLMPEVFAEKFSAGNKHWVIGILKRQELLAGRFASAVLTVEDRLTDILSCRGIPREKIHVFMNVPDDRVFTLRRTGMSKQSNDKFVMVYHGTLAHRLGLDIAIAAMSKVKLSIAHVELRIIGAGEQRDALIRLRDSLNLQDVVTFSEGFVSVEEIPAMIADADIGLIPLRISSATDIMLPTKLMEYVNLGIPCIVPRTVTISRYFDEDMVYYFESEDVDSLANAIIDLLHDEERRCRIALAARVRFSEKYSFSGQKKIYTDLVASLMTT